MKRTQFKTADAHLKLQYKPEVRELDRDFEECTDQGGEKEDRAQHNFDPHTITADRFSAQIKQLDENFSTLLQELQQQRK